MAATLYSLQDLSLGDIYEENSDGLDTDPIYVYVSKHLPKRQKWNKSRGQPDTSRLQAMSREASFTMSMDEDDLNSNCTPYRLPRLSGDLSPASDLEHGHAHAHDGMKSPTNDKVWSRYGYEKIIKIPELGPQVRMLMPPSRSYSTKFSPAPRFKNAAITPTVKSVPWSVGREIDEPHIHLYHGSSNQARIHEEEVSQMRRQSRLEPTPTPISRSESPAKSVKSIHWILGHNRYHTFDKKGRSHIQGPYSREFNVTCHAPTNWLKMKWGRSKTVIH